MAKLICYDSNGVVLDHLTQWDMGQTISIAGITQTDAPIVHIYNRDSNNALVVASEISDNKVAIEIPNILLQSSQPIIAHLCYYTDSSNKQSYRSMYTVTIPVYPCKEPDNYIYEDNTNYITLEAVIKDVEELLKAVEVAEEARVTAENERKENETSRNDAEAERINAETDRENAESARNTAESARAAAETKRANAETARTTAEAAREAAENVREAAEEERATAETARVAAEKARQAAETEREAAEAERVEAENARVAAETAREQACATAVADAEAATETLIQQVNRIAFAINADDAGLDIIVYEEEEE